MLGRLREEGLWGVVSRRGLRGLGGEGFWGVRSERGLRSGTRWSLGVRSPLSRYSEKSCCRSDLTGSWSRWEHLTAGAAQPQGEKRR